MKRTIICTLILHLMSGMALAADAPAAPISGIDAQYIDPAVRAQDDFFTYLNGKWLRTTQIPADKARWGTFDELRDSTQPQVRDLIEAARKEPRKMGSEAQKIGDLYASFMNEAKLEQLGYRPLAGELARIRLLRD